MKAIQSERFRNDRTKAVIKLQQTQSWPKQDSNKTSNSQSQKNNQMRRRIKFIQTLEDVKRMRLTSLEDVSLVEFMYPVFNRMPGGVIVGNSGLCCCVPVVRVTSIIVLKALLIPCVCCFLKLVPSATGLKTLKQYTLTMDATLH